MNPALEARAEIAKLARLLGASPESLGYLEKVPPRDLRRFREQATDVLFDADRRKLQRLAAASGVLPVAISASIGERAFGPLLCARIAGLLEPSRAIEVARRLPAAFLADVAVELDPRRVSEVLRLVSEKVILEAARELLRRGETVAMGRFVGHLSDDTLAAVVQEIDDAALLRIAFVTEDKDRLDQVIGLLPEDRLGGLIQAATSAELWPETLDLVSHLGARQRRKLADLAAQQDDAVLDGLVQAAQDQGLWDAVLPLIRSMSDESRRRFARLRSVQRAKVLDTLVRCAAQHDLWPELLPLVPLLARRSQRRVASVATTLDRSVLERVAASAGEHELWPVVVRIAADMEGGGQDQIGELLCASADGVLQELFDSVAGEGLWPQVLTIADRMNAEQRRRLAERALAAKSDHMVPSLVEAAEQTGLWETGLELLTGLDSDLQEQVVQRAAELSSDQRRRLAERAREHGALDDLGPLGKALTGVE